MANNNFTVVISAVDKTTAVVNRINQRIAAVTKPIGQVQSAVGRLNKEMGFDRVVRSMGDVAKAASDVAGQVAGIVAPMAAVAGVGSVAAIASLTVEWGKLGAEIARTSQTLGVSADQLQSLRGAAKVSGVSAESLTGGLKTLGDTMEDALYGRNQNALVMMKRLGIQMRTTADGAVDSSTAFMDLADQISKIKSPQVQALVARTFGIEASLPLLRQGRMGIEQLQAQVQATGAVMGGPALQNATKFYQSMGLLELSVDGLRNSIGAQLMPIVTPLLDQLSAWISANRDLIATKVGDFVQGVADAIQQIDWGTVVQGVKDFAAGVETLVGWLGGWENAAIAVGIVMAGPLISSVFNLTTSLLRLGLTAVPVVIRALGLMGVVAQSALSGSALRAGLFASRLSGLAAGVPLVGSAMQALSGAFVAVGAVIEATPIGWIVTGIAAIGVAGYELYEHWSDIGKWWHGLWNDIGNDVSRNTEKVKNASSAMTGSQVSGGRGGAMLDAAAKRTQERKAAQAANGVRAATENAPAPTPIGIRQNNPGNLRSWGDAPINNGYAQFGSAFDGISAMAGNLQAYGKEGFNTVDSIINRWAPAKDRNNVPKYVQDVTRDTGFAAGQQLNMNDPAVLQALIPAIIKHENGQNPYDAGMVSQAIASRLGRPVGVPSAPSAVVPSQVLAGVSSSPQLDAMAKQMGVNLTTPALAAPGAPVQTPYAALNQARIAAQNQAAAATPTPSGSASGGGVSGLIKVEIMLEGAPPGTKARVRSTGPVMAEVKIGHSMPDTGSI